MTWQDLVIGTGLWVLIIGAIGSIRQQYVRKKDLVPYSTSVTVSIVQLAITIAFVSLSYWASAIPCSILFVLWGIAAIQKYYYERKHN